MKIIGVREEKYIGTSVTGHNCNFKYEDTEMERHVILAILDTGDKVEITLEVEEGECGSGWCTASYGIMRVEKVNNFSRGFNYKPKEPIILGDLKITKEFYGDYSNKVFSVSYDGGDGYYPSGDYTINLEDYFIKTRRLKSKRPVYIFMGDSGVGKSSLGLMLKDTVKVFETDSVDNLPDSLLEDVIVLGNRSNFTLEDIKTRLSSEVEPIICELKRGEIK